MTDHAFWADCPDVQVDPDKLGGEPTVGLYRVAARTIVECEQLGETPEEIAYDYGLPLDKIQAILSYYHAHKAEIVPTH
ncbi:MAG: DUF433 domain-containing protein [Acidobacteriaceae bacterium]|nr:DUF433 domain-containing protein [Acidobacteriaceae bacterium]